MEVIEVRTGNLKIRRTHKALAGPSSPVGSRVVAKGLLSPWTLGSPSVSLNLNTSEEERENQWSRNEAPVTCIVRTCIVYFGVIKITQTQHLP